MFGTVTLSPARLWWALCLVNAINFLEFSTYHLHMSCGALRGSTNIDTFLQVELSFLK